MENVFVILVDKDDNEIGIAEKMEAHIHAQLHRAVSVFVFNSAGQWLIQRRALHKYHSNGLWSNTSCSHPMPGEDSKTAAVRRNFEEMGLQCELQFAFTFKYKQLLDNNLTEHELDHVFVGVTDNVPQPNEDEVMDYTFLSFDDLHTDVIQNPDNYSFWFKQLYQKVNQYIESHKIL